MDLIVKLLSKEISPDEKKVLDQWLNKSKENRKLLEEYRIIWNSSENYSDNSNFNPDVDAGYLRLKQRIETAKVEQPKQNTSVIKKLIFYSAAASLIFMVIGLSTWLYITQKSTDRTEFATNSGETKSITLNDGSVVILNQNSTLNYNEEFNNGTNRLVTLDGEAYFDVAHNPEVPFTIIGNQTEVRVLGTSFNYRSYSNDAQSSVQVVSGKVRFSGKSNTDEYKYVLLEKNESGTYDNKQKNLEKSTQFSKNNLAWNSGKLVFKNTPIDIVFSDIEKFYQINIDYSNSNVKKCKFNSIFNASPLSEVLENLKLSLNVSITSTSESDYFVSGGRKCK